MTVLGALLSVLMELGAVVVVSASFVISTNRKAGLWGLSNNPMARSAQGLDGRGDAAVGGAKGLRTAEVGAAKGLGTDVGVVIVARVVADGKGVSDVAGVGGGELFTVEERMPKAGEGGESTAGGEGGTCDCV